MWLFVSIGHFNLRGILVSKGKLVILLWELFLVF